jgi:hypothetical protein
MAHKTCTEKIEKTIKLSPVIQALQLVALFMGRATWQQKQPHTAFVIVLL